MSNSWIKQVRREFPSIVFNDKLTVPFGKNCQSHHGLKCVDVTFVMQYRKISFNLEMHERYKRLHFFGLKK